MYYHVLVQKEKALKFFCSLWPPFRQNYISLKGPLNIIYLTWKAYSLSQLLNYKCQLFSELSLEISSQAKIGHNPFTYQSQSQPPAVFMHNPLLHQVFMISYWAAGENRALNKLLVNNHSFRSEVN